MTDREAPRVSVVIPAYNEGDAHRPGASTGSSSRSGCRARCSSSYDSADDTTVPVVERVRASKDPRLRCIVNTYGRGPGQRDPVRHRRTPPRRSSW